MRHLGTMKRPTKKRDKFFPRHVNGLRRCIKALVVENVACTLRTCTCSVLNAMLRRTLLLAVDPAVLRRLRELPKSERSETSQHACRVSRQSRTSFHLSGPTNRTLYV